MNTLVLDIVNDTACLGRRQLLEYSSGTMLNDECHAVEMHLITCPYCSHALAGVNKSKSLADGLKNLDAGFISNHLSKGKVVQEQDIADDAVFGVKRSRVVSLSLSAIAASVVLLIGMLWFFNSFEFQQEKTPETIKESTTISTGSIYAQPIGHGLPSKEENIVR